MLVKAGDVTTDSAAVLINSAPAVSYGLAEKQERLESLRKLDETHGNIYSPSEGIITAKNVSTGELTTENASFIVSDVSGGIVFRTDVDEDSIEYISVGEKFRLKFRNGRIKKENCEVKRVYKADEGGRYTVELTVESDGELKAGEMGVMKGSVLSEEKYDCIPLNAIEFGASETRGEIYVAEESEGFFGKEYTAKKYSVNIRDKNNTDAGIDDLGLDPNSKIIISSSKK